ncbi:hypothetical protein MRY87_09545 [bacterium]|nr:hypothetical protein [bacterium]
MDHSVRANSLLMFFSSCRDPRCIRHLLLLLTGMIIGGTLLLALNGEISWWEESDAPLFFGGLVRVGLLSLGIVGALWGLQPKRDELPHLSGAALLILFCAEWLSLPFSLLQGPSIRGEILFFGFLAVTCWPFRRMLLPILVVFTPFFLSWCFFRSADGRLLFSDDNPTFLYRLLLLREHFPSIPFYNPLWNAGIDARDFFATGALNGFLLFSPLIYLTDLLSTYNILIILLLFFFVPGALFLAGRILRFSPLTCALASLLSLTSSLLWYRWALQFGTLGFITSSALLPIVLALGIQFLEERHLPLWKAALTVVAVSLMLLWSPSGLVCIPLLAISLCALPKLFRQRWWPLTTILILAVNVPWITLFWSVSNVSSFLDTPHQEVGEQAPSTDELFYRDLNQEERTVQSSRSQLSVGTVSRPRFSERKTVFKHKKEPITFDGARKRLREALHNAHPLLWLFLVPGLLLLSGYTRLIFTVTLLWLLGLGTVGALIKPQLELDRMLVILLSLASLPVARAISSVLEEKRSSLTSFLTCGFLIAGIFSVGSVILNRSVVPISFQDEEVEEISAAVKEHAGEGRTLFSGFILHDFSGGHLAPLPLMTGKPILASSPVHNLWSYQQIFPKSFLERESEGIQEYLDLMNVSLVFAHEPKWRAFFERQPLLYHQVGRIGKFSFFTRSSSPESYFLEGSGEILSQSSGSVRFRLTEPDGVLRFQSFPFLTVTQEGGTAPAGCHLSSRQIDADLRFVALHGCPTEVPLELRAVSPVVRWKRSYLGGGGSEE